MKKMTSGNHPLYNLFPSDLKGVDSLVERALDVRSSWNHATDDLRRKLDPALWELTHNPWGVLQTASEDRLKELLDDPVFRKKVDALVKSRERTADEPGWFQQRYDGINLTSIAYFSMEYMLTEALPICSGGLGNVAGDQLTAATDLGVPEVGVESAWSMVTLVFVDPPQKVRYTI